MPCEAICAEMTRSGRREQYCEMINMIICSSSRGQPIIPSSAFVQLYKHLTQNLGIKLNKYTCCGDTYLNKGWTPCLAVPSPAHNQPAQPSQHILGKKAAPSYPKGGGAPVWDFFLNLTISLVLPLPNLIQIVKSKRKQIFRAVEAARWVNRPQSR